MSVIIRNAGSIVAKTSYQQAGVCPEKLPSCAVLVARNYEIYLPGMTKQNKIGLAWGSKHTSRASSLACDCRVNKYLRVQELLLVMP